IVPAGQMTCRRGQVTWCPGQATCHAGQMTGPACQVARSAVLISNFLATQTPAARTATGVGLVGSTPDTHPHVVASAAPSQAKWQCPERDSSPHVAPQPSCGSRVTNGQLSLRGTVIAVAIETPRKRERLQSALATALAVFVVAA